MWKAIKNADIRKMYSLRVKLRKVNRNLQKTQSSVFAALHMKTPDTSMAESQIYPKKHSVV